MKKLILMLQIIAMTCFLSPAFAGQPTLTWTDNSNNESGFIIERMDGNAGIFAEVGRVAENVVTFADTTPDDQLYCYQVIAFVARPDGSEKKSSPSNSDCPDASPAGDLVVTQTITTTTTTTTTTTATGTTPP